MNIVDCLYSINKWWISHKVDNSFLKKRIRNEFSYIVKNLGTDSILALVGPSGCGKTTLLFHTVDYLIKMKVEPKRVLMFSANEPALFLKAAGIFDILSVYASDVLGEKLNALSSAVYVIIDEIERIKDWQTALCRNYEPGMKIKFIVTAPNAYLIHQKKLPLPCSLVSITPLSPSQFVEFRCAYKDTSFDYITYKSLLPDIRLLDDPEEYVVSLQYNIHQLIPFRREKAAIFSEFLLAGGYPSYFESSGASAEKDIGAWHQRLAGDILDRCLYGDILANYNVKQPENLKRLLYLIAECGGEERAYAGIGKTLGLNTVTVINHLEHLAENRFITVLENYSSSSRTISRKNKRIYLRDNGIKNALLRNSEILPEDYSAEIKNCCITLACDYAESTLGEVYFWRNNQREADIIIAKDGMLLPVSVIYKNEISRRDIRGIRAFLRSNFCRKAVVITKDLLLAKDGIFFVPFWLL